MCYYIYLLPGATEVTVDRPGKPKPQLKSKSTPSKLILKANVIAATVYQAEYIRELDVGSEGTREGERP